LGAQLQTSSRFPEDASIRAVAVNLGLWLWGASVAEGQKASWLRAFPESSALPTPWLIGAIPKIDFAAL
jgi:hypothetical protein